MRLAPPILILLVTLGSAATSHAPSLGGNIVLSSTVTATGTIPSNEADLATLTVPSAGGSDGYTITATNDPGAATLTVSVTASESPGPLELDVT